MTRPTYREIAPYRADPRPCAIDLSDNTNLWGAAPSATRVLRSAGNASLARYPEPYSETLKDALARYAGVSSSMIVTGCGSDDVLDSTIRACAEPGDAVAMVDPTFVMIPQLARANGLHVVRIPVGADADVDVERLTAANAAITYVCSPNNPTGRSVPRSDIQTIVERARGVVIVDEAYVEFQGYSAVDLVSGNARVVVARTMSKAFGLAGARVGYAIANPELIVEIEKARGPFKVASHAADAATAALDTDVDWVRARVGDAIESRERVASALREIGLAPLASNSNFVFVPIANSAAIASAMRTRDVAVRPFAGVPTFGDALRITIGPWELMEPALAALREAIAECA
jgi:histidinol-phosphate aminotransferase